MPDTGIVGTEVRIGDHPGVLASIDEPGVLLAVWRRHQARAQAADLQARHGGPGRALLTVSCRESVVRWCWPEALPTDPRVQFAAAEVIGVFRRLAGVRGLTSLPVRVEAIETRVCRRFHVDHVGLRLLCTLYGAGTEWLPEAAADRRQLGAGGGEVARDPAAVQALAPGDVALLKGHCHPRGGGLGLIHRSPEASPLAPRLLLAADLPTGVAVPGATSGTPR